MSLTVTTRLAIGCLRGNGVSATPPACSHPTATSPTNPTTTSAVRGEASLVSTMDTVCGRPAQHGPDAHFVGHLNRISIIAGLIVCCWRLWLPGADPGEAEAAVTLGRAGLLWRSRVAVLTDLGEACLTR